MIREAIERIVSGSVLSAWEAEQVTEEIMSGQATPAQIAAYLTALRMRGETVDEIVGMARVMRRKVTRVPVEGLIVDTCGTGGDLAGTFNISTAAAFVVAGAGVRVAKHGNRAMSSTCGSADVLEALGVTIALTPEQVAQCVEKVGIGFMFAPSFHPAMKHAAGPRKEIGIRTIFNILGPLTNPAGAKAQLVGVADASLLMKLAQALQALGNQHSLIVHGEDGLDEITITAATQVCEQRGDKVKKYVISPEDFGMKRAPLEAIKGADAPGNADMVRAALRNEPGPRRDVVALNAAAGLLIGGKAHDLAEGVKLALESIATGRAMQKLERLIVLTQEWK